MNRIMVNMDKVNTTEIAQETGLPNKVVEKVVTQIITDRNNHKREPPPAPPEGGISLRAAERKYGIKNETISRWVKRGYIPILLSTRRELYIDEIKLTTLLELYRQKPGQGQWTIRKANLPTPQQS